MREQVHSNHPAAAAAWPTLAGLQVVVMALLVGSIWRTGPAPLGPRDPVATRLGALDDGAAQAVQRRLASVAPGGALLVEGEARERSYLSLLAVGLGLEVNEVVFTPGARFDAETAVETTTVQVTLAGDAYALPAFIDGLHRQRATAVVRATQAQVAPGGYAALWTELEFQRPAPLDTSWVGPEVDLMAPAAGDAVPVLEQALALGHWRRFAQVDQAARERAATQRRALARELPAALVSVRRSGGTVRWSESAGLTVQKLR